MTENKEMNLEKMMLPKIGNIELLKEFEKRLETKGIETIFDVREQSIIIRANDGVEHSDVKCYLLPLGFTLSKNDEKDYMVNCCQLTEMTKQAEKKTESEGKDHPRLGFVNSYLGVFQGWYLIYNIWKEKNSLCSNCENRKSEMLEKIKILHKEFIELQNEQFKNK